MALEVTEEILNGILHYDSCSLSIKEPKTTSCIFMTVIIYTVLQSSSTHRMLLNEQRFADKGYSLQAYVIEKAQQLHV